MTFPRSSPTRRSALRIGLSIALGTGALPLSACGSDASGRYGGGDAGYVAGDGAAVEIPAEKRGEAIEFEGTTYEGEAFDAAEQRGHPLVINVWYASCAPCRKEAPDLTEIATEYAPKGVAFIGVNVRDAAGPAQAFQRSYEVAYPSLPDQGSEIMYALRGQVAPNAVPSTLVLDADGRAAARISGAADPSTLRAMIDRVLAE